MARHEDQTTFPGWAYGYLSKCPEHAVCLRDPKMSGELRGSFLDLRLYLFARSPAVPGRRFALNTLVVSTAVAAKVADRYAGDWVGDPAFADFMTFEGGWAERYLAKRGHLLPEVDRQVLERALEEPRRLWRVTEVGRDQRSPSWLEDLKAGRSASLPRAIVSGDEPGAVMLWRIVHVDGVEYPHGLPIMVPPAEVDEVGRILADDPGPDALATWYCTLLAS